MDSHRKHGRRTFRQAVGISVSCLLAAFFSLERGAGEVVAQVVQLPTFSTFRVGTTVLVPDGGSTSLGGINSASYGRTSRGVPILGRVPGAGRFFRNTAVGARRSATSTRVHADIIDLDEMDRAVLAEAARRRTLRGEPRSTDAARVSSSRGAASTTASATVRSHADIRGKAEFITRNIGRSWIE